MEKYFLFRKLMDLVSDYAEVVDADMNNWKGGLLIVGEADGQTIEIEVSFKEKEEKKDA